MVHGTIHPPDAWGNNSAFNFKVYGSGAISGETFAWTGDGSYDNKTFTYQAKKAHLEGFVVIDPANHTFNMNCTEYEDPMYANVYKNLKILGWRANGEAINAFRNSVISDCFFHVQDDVFYYGDRVKISNIVTWNDANGAVLYLTKGATEIEDSYFKDITVIYQRASWHYWDGGRVISMRDTKPGQTIENVQIKNVLVEDPFSAFPPFYGFMTGSGSDPITINNVTIENVRQEHVSVNVDLDANRGKPQNTLPGLDANRQFKNITFKNCYYNSKWLHSFEDGGFKINEFVDENSIEFIVDATTIPVSGVTIHNSLADLNQGATHQLAYTVFPTYATDRSVTWQSSNDAIATVDESGLVTAVGQGSADISVTTNDGSFSEAFTITVSPQSSLSEASLSGFTSVYPNPVTNTLFVVNNTTRNSKTTKYSAESKTPIV